MAPAASAAETGRPHDTALPTPGNALPLAMPGRTGQPCLALGYCVRKGETAIRIVAPKSIKTAPTTGSQTTRPSRGCCSKRSRCSTDPASAALSSLAPPPSTWATDFLTALASVVLTVSVLARWVVEDVGLGFDRAPGALALAHERNNPVGYLGSSLPRRAAGAGVRGAHGRSPCAPLTLLAAGLAGADCLLCA